MRRAERQVCDPEFIQQVLEEAQEIYLAFNTQDFPYIVPVNYVLYEGSLFFHSAYEGTKMDLLRADPRVAFSTAVDIHIEKTTTRYRGVCGHGIAEIVEDANMKNAVLKAFAVRYKAPCVFPVPERMFTHTCVVRIDIKQISGKHSRPEEPPRTKKLPFEE